MGKWCNGNVRHTVWTCMLGVKACMTLIEFSLEGF
jgi:hypothetical protein